MKRLILLVLSLAMLSGCAGQQPAANSRALTGPGITFSLLTAGKVRVEGSAEAKYDRSAVVDLVTIYDNTATNLDYGAVIHEKFGRGNLTYMSVPDTDFYLILLDGAVQPVILDGNARTLWQIRGLGRYFSMCRGIFPGSKHVEMSGIGLADFDLTWTLDFSDPRQGLLVKYGSVGGW